MRAFDVADPHWIGACNKRRSGFHIFLHDKMVLEHPKADIRRVWTDGALKTFKMSFSSCARDKGGSRETGGFGKRSDFGDDLRRERLESNVEKRLRWRGSCFS